MRAGGPRSGWTMLVPHVSAPRDVNQETITYLTNIVIGLILSARPTNYWPRRKLGVLAVWVGPAWTLTLADILFAGASGARLHMVFNGRALP